MKKNILIILNIFIIIFFIGIYYYESNKLIDCSKRECINTFALKENQNEKSKQVSGNIENKFHISTVADTEEIQISYEAIDGKEILWPVEINYKVYADGDLIQNGEYVNVMNGDPVSIRINRDVNTEYEIVSIVLDNEKNIVNQSSLKINKLDETKTDVKINGIFEKEVEYIRNNINEIVSDFEKEATNGQWYVVDIRLVKDGDKVAELEGENYRNYTNAIVIFEDGHYSYLVKLENKSGKYVQVGYYEFVQRPDEMVGWKQIGTDDYLDVGEVIYRWSIEQ